MKEKSGRSWPRVVSEGNVSVKVYEVNHATARTGRAYVLAWATPAGRKIQKFADPDEALTEARIKAAQLAAGRIEGAEMSRGDRDELQLARRVSGDLPVLTALKEWARARELTGGNVIAAAEGWAARNQTRHARVSVSDLITRFLKAKERAGLQTARNHGSIFAHLQTELGALQVDAISSVQLSAYLNRIDNPVTRNTHRKRMVTLWRWAQKQGYLPRDARTEAEQTDRAREEAPEIGIISAEKFATLLAIIREEDVSLLAPLVLAGFCGMRRDEIHGQKWEDISLDRKHVRVTKAKRGTPARRLIPLCGAAVEWLMLCADRRADVCHGLAVDRLRKFCIGKGHDLPDNCFRHAYISHSVAASGNVPQVALDSGNSPQIIHRHYRELVTQDEGKAWFEITPRLRAAVVQFGKTSNDSNA